MKYKVILRETPHGLKEDEINMDTGEIFQFVKGTPQVGVGGDLVIREGARVLVIFAPGTWLRVVKL